MLYLAATHFLIPFWKRQCVAYSEFAIGASKLQLIVPAQRGAMSRHKHIQQ